MRNIYDIISRDVYYETSADSLSYKIVYDGEVIFSGKAYKMPGEEMLRINVNKVCQPYLYQDLDIDTLTASGDDELYNAHAVGEFNLTTDNDTILENYNFLYGYDDTFLWYWQDVCDMSAPICDVYAPGVKVLSTYVDDYQEVYTVYASPTKVNNCVEYALYYTNLMGGWDTFCIQGTTQKKQTITQYTTDRAFDNTTAEFEANRYLSEVKTSYVFQTQYLTDEQSEKLAKHLIGSNKVYLHDLKANKVIPVLITDTSVEYQTYQTNGKKMAQYKINVVESQSKLRR